MIKRLLAITLFHATFSNFCEIESNFMSQLSMPLNQLFNESIQSHYGHVPTELELSTISSIIASSLFVGLLSGALITGQFMDTLGRKTLSIYVRGLLGLTSAICAIFSSLLTSIELFIAGHFLTGVGVSLKIVLIVYLSECAPDDCRGTVAIMLSSGVAIIQLIVQPLFLPEVFGNYNDWIVIPMINIVLCIIHMSIGSFLPSSPKHLYLNKHQSEKAKQSITFYQGNDVNTKRKLAEYEREKMLLSSEHLKLKEIWNEKHTRLPFLIIAVASMVPATSAIAVKSQYLQGILIDMGMSSSTASFSILTLVFATTPFSLLAPSLIEKLGRRILFLSMSILCCVEWALLAMSNFYTGTQIGPPIGMFGIAMGNVAFMLGILSITPILISELCPFAAKAKVTEFIQFAPVLVALGTVLLYPSMVHAFGPLYHVIMLAISLILFYTLYKILPETRLMHVDSVVRHLLNEQPNDYGSLDAGRIDGGCKA